MKSDTLGRDTSTAEPQADHSQSRLIISPFPANLLRLTEHLSAFPPKCSENQFCIQVVAFLVCLSCDFTQRLACYACQFNSLRRIKSLTPGVTRVACLCLAGDNYAAFLECIQKHFGRPERGIVH